MRLAALTLGHGVPAGDFTGRVRELHRRACVLGLDDDIDVTLTTQDAGALPFGITLATPADFAFPPLVAPMAACAARHGVLRIAGGTLAIDLRHAVRWRSPLQTLRLDLRRSPSVAAWHAVAAAVASDGRAEPLRHAAAPAIRMLGMATRGGNVDAAVAALTRLVGLGEGRTPAGDDFIVGFVTGLLACGADGPEPGLLALFRDRLDVLAARTGRASHVYLRAAAAGEVSQRLFDVLAAMAQGDCDRPLSPAVAAALAVGHSSGACGLLGLLHGSAAGCGIGPEAAAGAAVATAPAGAHASAESGAASPACSARHATAKQIAPSSA